MPRMVLALTALLLSLFAPAAAHAAVTPAASTSGQGQGSASAELTVPAGANRYLAVGVSTVESAAVTSVTFGPQVLTRLHASAKDSSRAEVWTLKAPNPGKATVTVTLSTGAAVVIGATSFTGVDQLSPVLGFNSADRNNAANSASLVLNHTVEADGMFGVLTVNDAANVGALTSRASVDTVAADRQWNLEQDTVAGAGATRRGNTGQNLALNTGISWFWSRIVPSNLMPHSNILVGLLAATADPPAVASPTATGITATAATLGGTVTGDGGGTVTTRGVAYCECPDPMLGGTKVELGGAVGAFSTTVTGLKPSTTYTYAAYAGHAGGTAHATGSFTTAAPPNLPPTVTAGGPYTLDEGGSLTLAGGGADPEGAPLTFAWDLDGDNRFEDAEGPAPALTPARLAALGLGNGPVTRTVRLGVSDGVNVRLSGTTTITVRNVAPTATLTGDTVDEGETATVAFSGQADPSDTAFTYEYAVGDEAFTPGGPTLAVPTTSGPATIRVRGAILDPDGGRTEYETAVEVRNVAPSVTVDGPEVVPASGAVTLTFAAKDVAAVKGTIDWGDGTVVPFAPGAVSHTYAGPGARTVSVKVADAGGAEAAASHALTVASLPAPHTPAPTPTPTAPVDAAPPAGGVLGAVESSVRISDVRVTPRCVRRSDGLKAVSAASKTLKVQFRVDAAADVTFRLERWKKAGFAKCPATRKGDRKVPGIYSPFTNRPVAAEKGLNTVTLATTRKGKALKTGTYRLTITAGESSVRTKVWVLAG